MSLEGTVYVVGVELYEGIIELDSSMTFAYPVSYISTRVTSHLNSTCNTQL